MDALIIFYVGIKINIINCMYNLLEYTKHSSLLYKVIRIMFNNDVKLIIYYP